MARSKDSAMKVVMMGSGGVGGYYGARLQQAGHDVSFVARGAHAEALRKAGLRIRSEVGDVQLRVQVLEEPAQAGPSDLVVVAVKLWDTESAARAVARVPGATVVSLQNGVDKDEVLAAAVGRDRVLGGITHIGAVIAEPGVIAHTGKLQRVTLGELDGSRTARLQAVADAFRSGGVETIESDDIRRVTWEKFVFLTALSGMTALTRKPVGEIRAHPATRAMLLDALRETAAVARAEGASIPDSFADKQMEMIDTLPAGMLSSMAQDLLRGRRLELPWLSGAVVRRAEKYRLAVPAHRAINAALVLYAG
jgi:2-dehydropantoate 2-reductase